MRRLSDSEIVSELLSGSGQSGSVIFLLSEPQADKNKIKVISANSLDAVIVSFLKI